MPLEVFEHSASELNAHWRGAFGAGLNAADKRQLAGYLGVTVRTVQRWTTSAGEMRNPFPVRLDGVPNAEWPTVYYQRLQVTRRLVYGGVNADPPEPPYAEFRRVEASAPGADRFGRDLERELIDPWLSAAWVLYVINKTADGWEVRVTYSTVISPKTQRLQEGDLQ